MAGVDLVLRERASDSSTENETHRSLLLQNGGRARNGNLLHDHLQLSIKERLFSRRHEWYKRCACSGVLIGAVLSPQEFNGDGVFPIGVEPCRFVCSVCRDGLALNGGIHGWGVNRGVFVIAILRTFDPVVRVEQQAQATLHTLISS